MRGRLITNGILSLGVLIGAIIYWVLKSRYSSPVWQAGNIDWVRENMWSNNAAMPMFRMPFMSYSAIIFFFIASFVMGIVTLSMAKHENARGLTIASGVLAILGGVIGAGAIVSFIAAYKAK